MLSHASFYVPPARICFLLCHQVAPLSSMDPLHSGDLPPRLPWEPTTPFRAPAPATPQHTTDSSMSQGNPLPLSICLCPSLTHFLPLPLCFFFLSDLAACSHNLPQEHSLRLIHHCLRPLYAVPPKCQTLATKRKNRGTHFLNTDTQIRMKEYKTPTT